MSPSRRAPLASGGDRSCSRRALVVGLAALAACGRRPQPERLAATAIVPEPGGDSQWRAASAPAATVAGAARPPAALRRWEPPAPPGITVRTIAFGPAQGGPQQAVIVAPAGAARARYPLLVALGGLGEGLHAALDAAGAEHDHLDLPGPHGYPFNRGPGAIEMLLWHDRVLRGEAPEL